MDPSKQHIMSLQAMPHDPLSVILSKVGASSSTAFFNTISTCKDLYLVSKQPLFTKDLCLAPIVKQPNLAKKYKDLFERCLAANNLDAHYVRGFLSYFQENEKFLGLHHLEIGFHGGHTEATFILGVLHMCLGMIEKGKQIISKLTVKADSSILDICFASIKTSLAHIQQSYKKVYLRSMEPMKPGADCHKYGMEASCSTALTAMSFASLFT